MNWGKWIVVSFVLFAAFIATLATVCMRQDVSLVSKDYYKEEMAYETQLTRLNNTNALASKPVISVSPGSIKIDFDSSNIFEKGQLILFCPSDSRLDRKFDFSAADGNSQEFSVPNLKKGMYRAKINWTKAGKEFYIEQVVYL